METLTDEKLEKLKYPIGRFLKPDAFSQEDFEQQIVDIKTFAKRLAEAVNNLNNEQLETPYRPGGWTIKQVVHHCADSHMNAFIRFKLALTEENPTIKPYHEARWAEQADYNLSIGISLNILNGVHARWAALLNSMQGSDFMRTFYHPEKERNMSLYEATALYAWHSNHHLAHILNLKTSNNW